jgi:hypothetical protein
MLPLLTALPSGGAPGERDYRLTIRAAPQAHIALRARLPHGWLAAFCTPQLCARGHVMLRVPSSGRETIALHVFRIDGQATRNSRIAIVDDRGGSLTLAVEF